VGLKDLAFQAEGGFMCTLRTICFTAAAMFISCLGAAAQSTGPLYIDATAYQTPSRDESQAISAAGAGCVASTGPAGSVSCSIKSPYTGYEPWSTNPFAVLPNGVDLDLSAAGVHDIRLQYPLIIPLGTHIHGANIPGSGQNGNYYSVFIRACNPAFMSGGTYGTACTAFNVPSASITSVSTGSGIITVTVANGLNPGQHAFIYDGTDPNALTGMFLVATASTSQFTISVPSGFSLTSCTLHCGTLYEGTPLIQTASGQVFDTEVDHLVLDCGWVRGCEPYVDYTGEEQDQIHDVELWNFGGAGVSVDELSFPAGIGVTNAYGVTHSSLGAINSGPWARGSIHFQQEVCELPGVGTGCTGLTIKESLSTTPVAISVNSLGTQLTITVNSAGLLRSNANETLKLSGFNETWLNGTTYTLGLVALFPSDDLVSTSTTNAVLVCLACATHGGFSNTMEPMGAQGVVTIAQGQAFDGPSSLPQVANCSTFGILATGGKTADVRQYTGWTVAFSHSSPTALNSAGIELTPEVQTMGWTGFTSCASGNGPGPGSSVGHFVYGQLAHFTDNHTEYTPTAYLIGNPVNHNLYWANKIPQNNAVTNVKIENEEFCITGICNVDDGNHDNTIVIGPNSQNVQIENANNGGSGGSYFISDETTGNACQGSSNWAQAWYWLGPVISGQPTPVMSSCQGITNQFVGPVSLGNVGSPLLQPWTSSATANAHLAKITASSTVTELVTSDITADGIVYSGGGLSGTAQLAVGGTVNCVFDSGGASAVGDYVQISNTTTSGTPTAGDCHDSGSTYPNNGGVVIGKVATTLTGGAANVTIDLQPPSPIYDAAGDARFAGALTLSTLLTPANGGTGQNTSSSTGVAQVSSGVWSVNTGLANGTTAATQTEGDDSTKIATTAYVDAQGCTSGCQFVIGHENTAAPSVTGSPGSLDAVVLLVPPRSTRALYGS
jgi:hypothetical protein